MKTERTGQEWALNEQKAFAAALQQVFQVYEKRLDPETLKFWLLLHKKITWPQAMKALEDYVLSEDSHYPPKPVDLVHLTVGAAQDALRSMYPDEDAAWALARRAGDESDTMVWTEEMCFAWGMVRNMGDDKIAQRKSFQSFYKNQVESSIQSGKKPVWIVSTGWDSEKRIHRMEEAIQQGILDQRSLSQENRRLLSSHVDPSRQALSDLPALSWTSDLMSAHERHAVAQIGGPSQQENTLERTPSASQPNVKSWNMIRDMVEKARKEKAEEDGKARLEARLSIEEKRQRLLESLSQKMPSENQSGLSPQ